jgi:hypothetical protein
MFDQNSRLSYVNKPYSKVRSYKVFPLSDNGVKEYIAPDSYTHNYLDKFSPAIMDFVNRNSKDPQEEVKEMSQSSRNNPLNREISNKINKDNNSFQTKIIKEEEEKSISKIKIPNKISHNAKNNSVLDRNRLVGKLNKNQIRIIKTKVPIMNTTKYNGFPSYAVPRTENLNISETNSTTCANFYNNKIKNTIALSNNGNFSRVHTEEDYLSVCSKENDKCQYILTTQTDSTHSGPLLPHINSYSKQPKTPKMFILGKNISSKQMGERYNPFNYDLTRTKSNIRRNVYGALFNH